MFKNRLLIRNIFMIIMVTHNNRMKDGAIRKRNLMNRIMKIFRLIMSQISLSFNNKIDNMICKKQTRNAIIRKAFRKFLDQRRTVSKIMKFNLWKNRLSIILLMNLVGINNKITIMDSQKQTKIFLINKSSGIFK